jgi:hypothetical protein
MLYVIWGFFSLIVFFMYPLFFSRIEMAGFSSFYFFIKRLVASVMVGGIALVLLAAFVQNGS